MGLSALPTNNELKDIRELWVIQDYSLYFFIALLVVIILSILLIIYYVKRLKKQKLQNELRVNINKFLFIDTSNVKDFSYESTVILHSILQALDMKNKNNPFIKKNSEEKIKEVKEKIKAFITLSEQYKYKKTKEDNINQDTKNAYENLARLLNDCI